MSRRLAGAIVASALTGALLASSWGVASGARLPLRDEDTCFGEVPDIVGAVEGTTYGTEGDDVILGGVDVNGRGGDDLICDADFVLGMQGNDRIRMLGGGTARGNGGDDEFVSITVEGDTDLTVLDGGPGDDIFWGGTQGERIRGGAGVDVAWAGGGNDLVWLGSGNDQGYGQPGSDRFFGKSGNDIIDGGLGADVAVGGDGMDLCRAVEDRTSCARPR